MIEESYVSFETAKMLKEAGFDVPCRGIYRSYRMGNSVFREYDRKNTKDDLCWNTEDGFQYEYLAPTQALAARWLREVCGIHVYADVAYSKLMEGKWVYLIRFTDKTENPYKCVGWFNSYEEALEEGLREAIKLIKK